MATLNQNEVKRGRPTFSPALNVPTFIDFASLRALVAPDLPPERHLFNPTPAPVTMKTFGEPFAGIVYIERPGGYAIIERDGLIAVVTTPSGTHLPGGGLDPGESAREATLREVREECGFDVEIVREIGGAD